MLVQNEIYIVYGEDSGGRSNEPYYFFNKRHACKFAIENKEKMAYGIPKVCKVVTNYNTYDMYYRKCENYYQNLSIFEIQQCAKEFRG